MGNTLHESGRPLLDHLTRIGSMMRELSRLSIDLDRPGGPAHDAVLTLGQASDRFDESLNGYDSRHRWRDLIDPPVSLPPSREPRGVPDVLLSELREPLGALAGAVHLLRESDIDPLDRVCLRSVYEEQTTRLHQAVDGVIAFVDRRAANTRKRAQRAKMPPWKGRSATSSGRRSRVSAA
ncbi:MAG: hypothetical protein CO113_04145 [Elusimicrobia bacterium CG_4_9_14_3_um_filter_62_55]|nr:MAG: hypothetical protein CO113_04145 [Elusimicrobia bacterium CG_4_9_14_3_um_filter_62_55]